MVDSLGERQHVVNVPVRPARTPAGDALTDFVVEVAWLGGIVTAAGETLAKRAGQTLARWVILDAIEDRPSTVAEIARRRGIARQAVQRVADLLEADGLAVYEPNPAHRRAKLLRPTPRGRGVLHTISVEQKAWADSHGAAIGEARLRSAAALIAAIRPHIEMPGEERKERVLPYVVDFTNVSAIGLESSPVAPALAGLRANEARYFKNKYDHDFTVEPAAEARETVDWVHRILKEERDLVIASRPLEATGFQVAGIRMAYVFYESGLSVNVMYTIDDATKRAVGFKLSDGMEVPEELASRFKFARQNSKLAGTIRGSYFVIKGEY